MTEGIYNQPMNKSSSPLLFLGKADDPDCANALEFCQSHFEHVTFCLGKWGDPLPETARNWEGDIIISYLSRWVVPADLLNRAKIAAIIIFRILLLYKSFT